ncbi:MAG: TetR/AcrR family transcriptional regulator [Pseudomonadota bacterium]
MGRKNLAEERIQQILDAFEHCIIEFGLGGATLQRAAKQAGVNIGIIHHYIGNREDLLRAMVSRFVERTQRDTESFLNTMPPHLRLENLLRDLFEEEYAQTDRIINELFMASHYEPFIKELLQEINQLHQELLANELKRNYPKLPIARCQQLAFTFLALAYGSGLMGTVDQDRRQESVPEFANLLLQSVVRLQI